jgi:hypothetical protein
MITGSVFFYLLDACELHDMKSAIQYSCVVSSVRSHSDTVLSDVKEVVLINVLCNA